MTLTFNSLRAMVMNKVNGQSVSKIDWKLTDGQTDGQTDKRMEMIALPAAVIRSVTRQS